MTQVPTRPADAAPPTIVGAAPLAGDAGRSGVRRVATGILFPVAAVALTAVALRGPGALSDLQQVAAALIVAAAISAAVLARSAERTPQWQLAAGTLIAAAAFGSYRLAGHLTGAPRHAAVAAGSGGALLVMAVSVHLALALPDGRLTRPPVPGHRPVPQPEASPGPGPPPVPGPRPHC